MSQSTRNSLCASRANVNHYLTEATIELNNCEYTRQTSFPKLKPSPHLLDLQGKQQTHLLSWLEETEGVQHALTWKITAKCMYIAFQSRTLLIGIRLQSMARSLEQALRLRRPSQRRTPPKPGSRS